MKIRFKHILCTLLLVGVLGFVFTFSSDVVFAQADTFGVGEIDQQIALGGGDIRQTVARIINVVLSLLGIIAVSLILYAGFVYMTAGGNEDRVLKARKILINAVIGLAIVLSAFAITRFVINRLGDATRGIDRQADHECADIEQCNDQFDGGGADGCVENHFGVLSITPSQNVTGMNNVAVRAVFSKGVGNESDEVLTILRDGVNVTREFEFKFTDANDPRVVEAVYPDNLECGLVPLGPRLQDRCIPLSNDRYQISVNNDVVDIDGEALEDADVCEGFLNENQVTAGVDAVFNDAEAPTLEDIGIQRIFDGAIFAGNPIRIPRDAAYLFSSTLADGHGVSYARIELISEDGNERVVRYRGPKEGQSADPFQVKTEFLFGGRIPLMRQYSIRITGFDIDHNSVSIEKDIVIVGAHCGQPGFEDDPACGRGNGDACEHDGQCRDGECIDNICVAMPRIDTVGPMSGAPGNFVTITGVHFGSDPGELIFRYDDNGDGAITPEDTVHNGDLQICQDQDVWHNNWIITGVPFVFDDARVGEEIGLQIEVHPENSEFFDTTTDDDEPKPGGDGLFRYIIPERPGDGVGGGLAPEGVTLGLCSVTVARDVLSDEGQVVYAAGSTAGPAGVAVQAVGTGFTGETRLSFGKQEVAIPQAIDDMSRMEALVPERLAPGIIGVFAQRGDEFSNGVPFEIIPGGRALALPEITRIDPQSSTPGSAVTILGIRLGQRPGSVFISPRIDVVQGCPGQDPDPSCRELRTRFLGACAQGSWTPTAVIAELPADLDPGDYFVVLQNDDGLRTQVVDERSTLTVVEGEPNPSLCAVVPDQGPAPRPDNSPLTLFGQHLEDDGSVRFWGGDEPQQDDLDTWLIQNQYELRGPLRNDDSLRLVVDVPYNPFNGQTMLTGPIAYVSADGRASNPVFYTVEDCREAAVERAGMHCCVEGADAGRWLDDTISCEGQTRDAGYMWRFTTGVVPQIPSVVEFCQALEFDNQGEPIIPEGGVPTPSPSPWVGRLPNGQGLNACLNSTITLRFSTPIDEQTLDGRVKVYTCAEGENDQPDCSFDNKILLSVDEDEDGVDDNVIYQFVNNVLEITLRDGHLEPGTWYHVELLDGIMSSPEQGLLEGERIDGFPLRKTRSCDAISDDATAYCFDFRTTDDEAGLCTLIGAGINPPLWSTKLLGVVQDPRYRFNVDNPFDPPHPLYYYTWGMGSNECSMIDVDKVPWRWGVDRADKASVQKAPNDTFVNRRAKVTALADTSVDLADGVDVSAAGQGVVAQSVLHIDLSDPTIVDYAPACAQACINTDFSVQFSQLMMRAQDFNAQNILLEKCTNSRCRATVGGPIAINVDNVLGSDTQLIFRPRQYLEPNAWYTVTISNIHAVGAIDAQGDFVAGNAIDDFSWKFHTKNDETPCLISNAQVSPNPHTAHRISQKDIYRVKALGAPDGCSAKGQALDPWTYGWNWSSLDVQVAEITSFESRGSLKPQCTIGCTPAGSVIARGQDVPSLCGNGIVESGEDCDIGGPVRWPRNHVDNPLGVHPSGLNEIPGISCSLSCERPGSGAATCGNGILEPQFGETCDEGGDKNQWQYCNANCTNKGSSQEIQLDNAVCGVDGGIELGEDCDIADPNSAEGCSASCLNEGSALSQQWCDDHRLDRHFNSAFTDYRAECAGAISVCGNGVVELGEECEFGLCSSRCLVGGNVCGTPFAQCDRGEQGCSDGCVLQGSGLSYDEPSICGDGIVGTGENITCELTDQREHDQHRLGQNPVQLVTAVGEGAIVDPGINFQRTQIRARTEQYRLPDMSVEPLEDVIEGSAEYILQCGFTEYPQVQDLDGNPRFNDCPDAAHGVGTNSCCYQRPTRVDEYPRDGAGFPGAEPDEGEDDIDVMAACPNTLIEVSFSGHIAEDSLSDNVVLVRGYEENENPDCVRDFTDEMQDQLAFVEPTEPRGFFGRIWYALKSLLSGVLGDDVYASLFRPGQDIVRWCAYQGNIDLDVEYTRNDDGRIVESRVIAQIDTMLDFDAHYGIYLRGGLSGIKDARSVGIISPDGGADNRDDVWLFRTQNEECELAHVAVEPEEHLFTTPNTAHEFRATAFDDLMRPIVRTPQVNWAWSWGPSQDPVFAVPVEGINEDQEVVQVSSKDLEGGLRAVVAADDGVPPPVTAEFLLTALFCEVPWPAAQDHPFADDQFNFSMSYCASDGPAGPIGDLPVLSYPGIRIDNERELADEDLLVKYLFVAGEGASEEALGVQVFRNPERLPVEDWFERKFESLGGVQRMTVAGLPAIGNEHTVYVDALNFVVAGDGQETIYNNIYQLSINEDASVQMQEIFRRILDSFTVNTNISEHGFCLQQDVNPDARHHGGAVNFDLSCRSDFDCVTQDGASLQGTNGVCANIATKMYRDQDRLRDISLIQTGLRLSQPYPEFEAGSFLQGVAIDRWQSAWNSLGDHIGFGPSIPKDPLNTWTTCGDNDQRTCWDALNATFVCPAMMSTYIYQFDNEAIDYQIYANLEFIHEQDEIFIDLVDEAHFTPQAWCRGDEERVVEPGFCGDGVVNPNEQCDPQALLHKKERCVLDEGLGLRDLTCRAPLLDDDGQPVPGSGCVWDRDPECRPFAQCGNNIVEAGEACDDGRLNGTYGHCNEQCNERFAAYCGNQQLDIDANGNPLEYCDETAGVCQYMTDDGQVIKPRVYVLLDRSGSMLADAQSGGNSSEPDWQDHTRWRAALDGLDRVRDAFGPSIELDVAVFPRPDLEGDGGDNECADPAEVAGLNYHDQIYNPQSESRRDHAATSLTPTNRAVRFVNGNNLIDIPADPFADRRPKIFILITDGVPADECAFDGEEGSVEEQTRREIAQLYEQEGVPVYVVGFGFNGDTAVLDSFAEAGGTNNPQSEEHRFYNARTADGMLSVFDDIIGCSSYNRFERGSCSLTCQAPGGFCGDGIVQIEHEQCDDANDDNEDACFNNCLLNERAPADEGDENLASFESFCGDGEVQNPNDDGVIEVCDLGNENGRACSPEYGRSCTYCSFDCRNVLTVDPAQFCGDGVIDYDDADNDGVIDYDIREFVDNERIVYTEELYEQCDIGPGGQPIGIRFQPESIELGQQPVFCEELTSEATDYYVGEYRCENQCGVLVNGCVNCTIHFENGPIPQIALLNPIIANDQEWPHDATYGVQLYNPAQEQISTIMRFDVFENPRVANDLLREPRGIETNPICSEHYKIIFKLPRQRPSQIVDGGLGDAFDYPVSGEGAGVSNEYIYAPAVPARLARVVVRWGKAEHQGGTSFGGVVYSDQDAVLAQVNEGMLSNAVVNYTRAALEDFEGDVSDSGLCGILRDRQPGEWWDVSNDCPNYFRTGLDVHPIVNTDSRETFAQAFTFNLTHWNDGEQIPFVVESHTGPMAQFADSNVSVEVYTYQEGQDVEYSIFKPEFTFNISDVNLGNRPNPVARYWHVMNLEKVQLGAENAHGEVRIHPIQEIETGFCDVIANAPAGPDGLPVWEQCEISI